MNKYAVDFLYTKQTYSYIKKQEQETNKKLRNSTYDKVFLLFIPKNNDMQREIIVNQKQKTTSVQKCKKCTKIISLAKTIRF